MTTTEAVTDTSTDQAVTAEPELCWLNLADLAPHPDDPRASHGDMAELVRSMRSHGILEPLVVLPADDDGKYRIVAGHRRHAAGIEAGRHRRARRRATHDPGRGRRGHAVGEREPL